jgi:hypothetical protein
MIQQNPTEFCGHSKKMNNNGFDGEKIVDLVKTTLAELKQ